VFEHIRMVASMKSMAITEHAAMISAMRYCQTSPCGLAHAVCLIRVTT